MPRIESVVQETNGKIDLAKVSETIEIRNLATAMRHYSAHFISFTLSYLDTQWMLLFYCHLVDADS